MITTLITITAVVISANLLTLALVVVSLPVLNKSRVFLLALALDIIQVWRAAQQARIDVDNEQLRVEANERKLLQ